MSSSIKTNQLVCFTDRKQFADCYDVYYLETIDKYIKRGAYILDVAELDYDIKSINLNQVRGFICCCRQIQPIKIR